MEGRYDISINNGAMAYSGSGDFSKPGGAGSSLRLGPFHRSSLNRIKHAELLSSTPLLVLHYTRIQ